MTWLHDLVYAEDPCFKHQRVSFYLQFSVCVCENYCMQRDLGEAGDVNRT